MRVLVTGGAGFIGSHVCEALVKRGDNVICVDNFNDFYDPNIKERNISNLNGDPLFKLYRLDICDEEGMRRLFEKENPEKIIHLAARAGVRRSINDPLFYEVVNIRGTLILLELARRHNIKNFVFASSSSVYGHRTEIPFKETDSVDNPISPYAATKKACELFCSTFHRLYGLKITCLRFFTTYGPRGRPDMAPYKFIKSVRSGEELIRYGDGSTMRDYTYIGDVVQGVIAALDTDLDFEIINLGNGTPVLLRDFMTTIEKVVGKKANYVQKPVQPGDVPVTHADITKARELLGYNPTTSVEEGIKKTAEWFGILRSILVKI